VYLLTAASCIMFALFVVAGSKIGILLHFTIALALATLLTTLCLLRPAAGIPATFVYLIFLTFFRRLLIPAAGWVSFDPMLLVGYLVAIVLIVKLCFFDRRPLAPDLLSKLVLALVVLTVLQVANPTGAGFKANLVGLLYAAAPLLWYFVGRAAADDALSDRLSAMVVIVGLVVAAYGLYQTQVGDPPWDVNWLNTTGGYASLNVGDTVRAFGTFSSSAEYTLFIGAGLAIAFSFFLRGRPVYLLAIPLLAVALFLGSGRSSLITAFTAVVVMLALRPRRPVLALVITIVAVAAAYGGLTVFGSSLSSSASGSSSLVSHQLGGISDPLNPNSSTLLVHISLVVTGFTSGFTHPEGKGPGVTNQAAGLNQQQSATQQSQATEVDISNAFVSLGLVGGFLYLWIVLLTLWKAVTSYFAGRDAALPVIGLLVVGAGQWLIGGAYALSPLTWVLIGGIAAGSAGALSRQATSQAEPAPAAPGGRFAPAF
jgi:hypothetical protein